MKNEVARSEEAGRQPIDLTVIRGVNDDFHTREMTLVSNGSCTTNCVVPMAKVLHDNFGIESGLMTTAHAYMASQRLVDGLHNDLRRARTAPQNIITTATSAADLVGEIIPDLKGRLTGMALRGPIDCGNICIQSATAIARSLLRLLFCQSVRRFSVADQPNLRLQLRRFAVN